MKILFLHPPWPGKGFGLRSQNRWPRKRGDKTNRYPLLLCYVATLLKSKGHEVSYIDSVIQDFNELQTMDEIAKLNPDAIYIETSTSTFDYDCHFINELKKRFPKTFILLAGSHVTYDPVGAIKSSKADVVIKGEQDYTTLKVITAISQNRSLEKINGVCFRKNKSVKNNPPAELIRNLDELPFPDRDLIPHKWYIEGHARERPFTFIMASRGCPNNCAYCLWPNIYFNHRVRFRSIKNVIDEIKWLITKYNIKEIFFDDDTFNTSKKHVIDICNAIINNNIRIIWSCSARVDIVDEEMLSVMKKSGCKLICYGGESANQATLDRIQKGITVSQIEHAISLTKKAGIMAHLNLMLGFPWETKQDMENTIKFALKTEPDTVQFSLVFPHPGSKMFYEAIEKGWFYDNVLGNWSVFDMTQGPVLKTPIEKHQLVNIVSSAHARFFLRPSYMLKQIAKINNLKELKRVARGGLSVMRGKIFFRGKSDG